MLSMDLSYDQLAYAASKLEAAQVALKAGHLTVARMHILKFWSDKGVGNDYDDFDAADNVAELDCALCARLGSKTITDTQAEAYLVAQYGAVENWGQHIDEAIDDLNSRG